MGVEFAEEVDAPLEEAEGVVDAELEPVEAFAVAGEGFGWIDVVPGSRSCSGAMSLQSASREP